MAKTNPKKIGILIVIAIITAVVVYFSQSIVETVEGGEIHVKQAAITGTLTIRTEEGLYMQMFGKITKYFRTFETNLSNDTLDGGSGLDTAATTVRFGDGGTADIGSVTQWRMPLVDENIVKIHRNYRSFSSLAAQVRQWVIEVEKQTASTFKADETYSTRRGEFSQLITDQIANGLYATTTEQVEVVTSEKDEDGNTVMASLTQVVIKRDDSGNPIIVKPGIFQEYNLELVNHSLKDIDYDETIDALIAQKKKAEQERAEATANQLKVRAGLTPQQQAEWDYKIADVVSKNMASVDLPDMMIFGGGEGSPMNPWDAVGLESFMNISEQIQNQ